MTYVTQPISLADIKRDTEREFEKIKVNSDLIEDKFTSEISIVEPPSTRRPGNPLFGNIYYAAGIPDWSPDGGTAGFFIRGPDAWLRLT